VRNVAGCEHFALSCHPQVRVHLQATGGVTRCYQRFGQRARSKPGRDHHGTRCQALAIGEDHAILRNVPQRGTEANSGLRMIQRGPHLRSWVGAAIGTDLVLPFDQRDTRARPSRHRYARADERISAASSMPVKPAPTITKVTRSGISRPASSAARRRSKCSAAA
jgi:hypothetical protein